MKKRTKALIAFSALLVSGFLLPERIAMPVAGATPADWNAQSFWFEPWGSSGVHKGIDIFGKTGTQVVSTTDGLVISPANWNRAVTWWPCSGPNGAFIISPT